MIGKEIIFVQIFGMMCQKNCGTTVQNALASLAAVSSAQVSFADTEAKVELTEGSSLEDAEVVAAVEAVGFGAEVTKRCVCVSLEVEGKMWGKFCMKNCGATVDAALRTAPGVVEVVVSLKRPQLGRAVVTYEPSQTNLTNLISTVEAIGFGAKVEEQFPSASPENNRYFELSIDGMMCQKNCGTTVYNALRSVPGVTRAEVCFTETTARVWGSSSLAAADLVSAVAIIGFGAELVEGATAPDAELKVEGMMCQKNCGTTVTNALSNVKGVSKVLTSFALERALVWGDFKTADLISALMVVGFGASETKVDGSLQSDTKPPAALEIIQCPRNRKGSAELRNRERSSSKIASRGSVTAIFSVKGMSCAACVASIEKNLGKTPGILGIKVALLAERAEVRFDSSETNEDYIANTISSLGYTAKHLESTTMGEVSKAGNRLNFEVLGMSCAACVGKVEKGLKKLTGVAAVAVALTTNSATVNLHPGAPTGPREIIQVLTDMGYKASLKEEADDFESLNRSHKMETRKWRNLFLIALIFTVPLVMVHTWYMNHMDMSDSMDDMESYSLFGFGLSACEFIMWGLASPVQFYVGAKFYRNSYLGLRHGTLGMDFLVIMGTSAAYGYSLIVMCYRVFNSGFEKPCVFDTAAMLLTFVTMGKLMEASAKGRTSQSITALMQLRPDSAFLVQSKDTDACDQAEVSEISVQLIQPGDILKVLAGARIPTDGEVVKGATYVDESMITGESMPVEKSVGSMVFGSTVNQHGICYVRATNVGADTALSQIIQLVQDAQTTKAPIQEYADRIAGVFVPFVMVFSFFCFCFWLIVGYSFPSVIPEDIREDGSWDPFMFSLLTAISVMVVACPCALGLATPTAVMVGTGVGAQNGILMKSGEAIEMAKKVTAIIFDKTGTITTGKPVLTDIVCFENATQDDVLRIAGAAEKDSEHPLGRAIFGASASRSLVLPVIQDFEVEVGRGVRCVDPVQFGNVLVGNRTLLLEHNCIIPQEVDETMKRFENEGKTSMCVTSNGKIIGVISVADIPKPEALSAVSALQHLGLQVWMVTGDNPRTANALARQVGITPEYVQAGVLPAQKVERVRDLQSRGYNVAMVGDGINDSPALAQADIGIAIGAGAQVAIEAADMVLVRNHLHDVYVALHLSRAVFSRIKLNFFWALGYNTVMIPMAAGFFIPLTHTTISPQLAALAMAFSSSTVVLSSLFLRLYSRPEITTEEDSPYGNSSSNIVDKFIPSWMRSQSGPGYSKLSTHEDKPLLAGSDYGKIQIKIRQ